MSALDEMRRYIRSHVVALSDSGSPDQFNHHALSEVAKWSIAAFSLVSGIATFFGVREGALDRLLRADPKAALWVFVLVGLGVICGLFAPAFSENGRVFVSWVPLVMAVLGLVSWLLFPDIDHSTAPEVALGSESWLDRHDIPLWLTLSLLLFLIVSAALLHSVPVPTTAAVLLLAVASISMGLYGATKLSVTSKSYPVEPSIRASVETVEGVSVVKVLAVAARRDGKSLHLSVIGVIRSPGRASTSAGEIALGEADLPPDAAGDVNTSLSFPVDISNWHAIVVRSCDGKDTCSSMNGESIQLAGGLAEPFPRVSGSVRPLDEGQGGEVAMSVTALPSDSRITATIYERRRGTDKEVAAATLIGDASGAATWTSSVKGARSGDKLILRYSVCRLRPALECEPAVDAASLTILR